MANYYTQFSFTIPATEEEVERIKELREEVGEVHEPDEYPARVPVEHVGLAREDEKVALFTDHRGTPQDVARVLQAFFEETGRDDEVFFQYAYTCSKDRPDAFGGGAVFVSKNGWDIRDAFSLEDELKASVQEANNQHVEPA